MPDKDKNFGGSLVFDFRIWWRHVQPKNSLFAIRDYSLFSIPVFHTLGKLSIATQAY